MSDRIEVIELIVKMALEYSRFRVTAASGMLPFDVMMERVLDIRDLRPKGYSW